MPQIESNRLALSSEEKERLDGLLGLARRFNHLSFVISGIALTISTLDNVQTFSLSIGNLAIPIIQTTVGLFVAVIAICSAIDWVYLEMAAPWLKLDNRRVPFPWIALGGGRLSYLIWTRLPTLITGIGLSITLNKLDLFPLTLFLGLVMPALPVLINDYARLLSTREDRRGGPATYSIYLLYWLRMFRSSILIFLFFLGILSLIPPWKTLVVKLNLIFWGLYMLLFLVRFVGTLPFVYKWIDRRGVKRGFPKNSVHYN